MRSHASKFWPLAQAAPNYVTNSAPPSRAHLIGRSILTTKDQIRKVSTARICGYSEAIKHAVNYARFASTSRTVRALALSWKRDIGVGLLAALTVKPLLNRRKSDAARLAARPRWPIDVVCKIDWDS